jgi:hypothetical protein
LGVGGVAGVAVGSVVAAVLLGALLVTRRRKALKQAHILRHATSNSPPSQKRGMSHRSLRIQTLLGRGGLMKHSPLSSVPDGSGKGGATADGGDESKPDSEAEQVKISPLNGEAAPAPASASVTSTLTSADTVTTTTPLSPLIALTSSSAAASTAVAVVSTVPIMVQPPAADTMEIAKVNPLNSVTVSTGNNTTTADNSASKAESGHA